MIHQFKRSAWCWVPLFIMLAGFVYLHPRISIGLNPDLTSYFAIARHYSRFEIFEALNAYWSPMISWLLIPFFWFKIDPVLSLRLLMVLTTIGVYWLSAWFIRLWTIHNALRFSSLLAIAFLNLYYALSAQTPDFLSVFFTLVFLQALMRIKPDLKSVLWVGATILFCFFTKSFLLPFTLSLLVLVLGYAYWKTKSRWLLKAARWTLLVLVSGLFIWASLMKFRYDRWMLSSAYAYNTTVFGPQGDQMHYTSYASLIDPPSPHATFGWQDPTLFNLKPVYFWTSKENFNNQLLICKKNLAMWPYLFRYFSWFSYGLLIAPLLMLFQFKKRQGRFAFLMYTGFLVLLCAYSFVFIKERYLAPGHYLIFFSFVFLFDWAVRSITKYFLPDNRKGAIARAVIVFGFSIAMLISFAKNPVQQIRYCMNEKEKLEAETNMAYEIAMTGLLDHKRVATFTSASGLYNYMPLASYLSEASFYGELSVWKPSAEQEKELLSNSIDFFFYNNCSNMDVDGNCLNESMPSWLEQYPVVYENKRFKVKILDLRNPVPKRMEDAFSMNGF